MRPLLKGNRGHRRILLFKMGNIIVYLYVDRHNELEKRHLSGGREERTTFRITCVEQEMGSKPQMIDRF